MDVSIPGTGTGIGIGIGVAIGIANPALSGLRGSALKIALLRLCVKACLSLLRLRKSTRFCAEPRSGDSAEFECDPDSDIDTGERYRPESLTPSDCILEANALWNALEDLKRQRRTTQGGNNVIRSRRFWFWLLVFSFFLHLGLLIFAPSDGRWVEAVFARRIYPVIGPAVSWLSARVPFSLAALAIGLLVLWVPGFALWNGLRWRRGRLPGLRAVLARTAAGYAVVFILVFHAFFFCWGYHYLRPPLERRLDLPSESMVTKATTPTLDETARQVIHDTNAARLEVGVLDEAWLDAQIDAALQHACTRLEDGTPAVCRPVKRPWPSGLLAAFGTLGVISPWTLEAHVDPGLPPAWKIFTAAHEKAHLAGFAPERDANFVAWLALTEARDPRLRYAGCLGVVGYFLNPQNVEQLSPAVQRDLKALRDYSGRHVLPWLQSMSQEVYRVYLRANRVEEGLADYGRVAELIHRWSVAAR